MATNQCCCTWCAQPAPQPLWLLLQGRWMSYHPHCWEPAQKHLPRPQAVLIVASNHLQEFENLLG